jgi:hypothetical protein
MCLLYKILYTLILFLYESVDPLCLSLNEERPISNNLSLLTSSLALDVHAYQSRR